MTAMRFTGRFRLAYLALTAALLVFVESAREGYGQA